MKALRRSSAAMVLAWMKRRACFIWPAKRSVGVGDEGSLSSLGVGDGLGWSSRARSSYMGFRGSCIVSLACWSANRIQCLASS